MSRPVLMLIALTAIWGMTFTATKTALSITDPIHFIALRFGIATAILTPFILRYFDNRYLLIYLKSGLVGLLLFISYILQTVGMKWTTASRSAFFTGLLVIFTPLVAFILRTSRVSWANYLSAIVALSGVWLMAEPQTDGLNQGDVLTIFCALTFAFQMVSLEWMLKNVNSFGLQTKRKQYNRLIIVVTYIQIFVVALCAFGWGWIEGKPLQLSINGMYGLVYNVLFGSLVAVYLQTRYQPMVPAGYAALIFSFEPVFAAIFGSLIMGDKWTLRGLTGAFIILLAMVFCSLFYNNKNNVYIKNQ